MLHDPDVYVLSRALHTARVQRTDSMAAPIQNHEATEKSYAADFQDSRCPERIAERLSPSRALSPDAEKQLNIPDVFFCWIAWILLNNDPVLHKIVYILCITD